MDKHDYRNTTYCPENKEIIKKKKELEKKIRIDGHKTDDLYVLIRDKYKNEFMNIYNYKCSYCGAHIYTINNTLLEIDHYKNKASYSDKKKSGSIENLVLACQTCNRGKSAFEIQDKYKNVLSPDKSIIKSVFKRELDYSIKVKGKYKSDIYINEFYENLKLDYEYRKLDFLLLNLEGLYKNLKNNDSKTKIGELLHLLKNKRAIIRTKDEIK